MIAEKYSIGKILAGNPDTIQAAFRSVLEQPVDMVKLTDNLNPLPLNRTTLKTRASVEGPGTFEGRKRSSITFVPYENHSGWWIRRMDLPESLDTLVSIRNVWTSARNIVLRSGSPHNYLRMVEHIIALRLGLGVDDLIMEVNSGDPPLFDRSSLDLIEAIQKAEITEENEKATYITVKEPVTIGGERGDFVTLLPTAPGDHRLRMDVAIKWNTIIGQQRIQFDVTPEIFTFGAQARTNATQNQLRFAKTFGFLFADLRHLGYTQNNILIHGKKRYINEPRLVQPDGKSLEPVWHRATLDLLAAIALLDTGRFCGTVLSYRAGHSLDVKLMTLLTKHNLLTVAQ